MQWNACHLKSDVLYLRMTIMYNYQLNVFHWQKVDFSSRKQNKKTNRPTCTKCISFQKLSYIWIEYVCGWLKRSSTYNIRLDECYLKGNTSWKRWTFSWTHGLRSWQCMSAASHVRSKLNTWHPWFLPPAAPSSSEYIPSPVSQSKFIQNFTRRGNGKVYSVCFVVQARCKDTLHVVLH